MSRDILGEEQDYITMLYGRLDELREQARQRLSEALVPGGSTPQARMHRDASVTHHSARLAQLEAVEEGLCFGRLNLRDGDDLHIGRLGMLVGPDRDPVLIDWRAPAAQSFYTATGASPEGVARRRHIRTRRRAVLGVEEDVLDLDAAGDGQLTGEAALLAALEAGRTGRMDAIVATIQAEQDRIIRSPHEGVLVVEGGPGTGKTAVALHRAAYLLYTRRRRLEKEAVLVVGPNATFMRYIEQVLPSLGESGVVMATVADLYPGVVADATEDPRAAEVKGRALMAGVVAAALRDRERAPDAPIEIRLDRETLTVQPATVAEAVMRARATGRTHNRARRAFRAPIIAALALQLAERIGTDPFTGKRLVDDEQLASLRRDVAAEPRVQSVLDRLWPHLTPQQRLRDLFASPERLATAAPDLTQAERDLLVRPHEHGWTPADVPLLDEAAELLGAADEEDRARERKERKAREAYAQGVIDFTSSTRTLSREESVLVSDVIDAKTLAQRQEGIDYRSAAERAAADRTWAYGHVVVDEAQELSAMAWRVVGRRCPSRSMTLVGDIAQTGDPAGSTSWEQVLAPLAGRRWRVEQLTVNYRTPAEIADVAADVLAAIDPALEAPRAVRATGVDPWRREVAPSALAKEVAAAVADELADMSVASGRGSATPRAGGVPPEAPGPDQEAAPQSGSGQADEGRMAVIAPAERLAELAEALPDADADPDPDLASPLVLLTVGQAKGLEFDRILVADPDAIINGSPRGLNDLYVAITRATQHLGVLHTGPAPAVLQRLTPRAGE